MTDRETGQPVMSPASVEAAARSARAQVTCPNLQPDDPGHPRTTGGFWGAFTRSLEGRWEQFKNQHEEAHNTFDKDDADGQTKLVTDGGRDRRGDGSERSSVSIAREHLLGATVWAYGGGAARVRPWTSEQDIRMVVRLRA
ncbi:hypothetical protein DQW50_16430 [Halorubrum sp. 48-1-W]|nr:hypothetical protein DQW50_16430 [Halorubrum sp. 48-1-W]